MSYTFSRRDFLKYSADRHDRLWLVAGAGLLTGCERSRTPTTLLSKKRVTARPWAVTGASQNL